MTALLRLLRPKQWTKNLLVFAAPLFTNYLTDLSTLRFSALAFAAMCLLSSATYVLNDLLDIERDRVHPRKRLRPLASGEISPRFAWGLLPILLFGGLGVCAMLGLGPLLLGGLYLAFQCLYNFGAKLMPVTDVFVLSLGFVLRATLGAAAIDVRISGWLLFCTGALALLLGFGKRRYEYGLLGEDRARSRESLAGYTLPMLDALVAMSASGAALCYGIYSLESTSAQRYPGLVLTSLFVFYGISRYVYRVFEGGDTGEPETLLLTDTHLWISILCFTLTALYALSMPQIPWLETR